MNICFEIIGAKVAIYSVFTIYTPAGRAGDVKEPELSHRALATVMPLGAMMPTADSGCSPAMLNEPPRSVIFTASVGALSTPAFSVLKSNLAKSVRGRAAWLSVPVIFISVSVNSTFTPSERSNLSRFPLAVVTTTVRIYVLK